MEKRTSSTELRLGLNLEWKNNYLTSYKYYNDSIKTTLFLNYILNGLQNDNEIIIPNPLTKYFISHNKILINFAYINKYDNYVFINLLNRVEKEDLTLVDENQRSYYSDSFESSLLFLLKQNKKITKKLIKSKKLLKIKRNISVKKKKLKRIFFHQLLNASEIHDSNPKFLKKKLFILNFNSLLCNKLKHENLNIFLSLLLKKQTFIHSINLSQILSKNPAFIFKNFIEIQNWFKKFGGSLINFKKNLITTHYALTYNHCIPLLLNLYKTQIEKNLTKQRLIMNTTYNLLFAYTWVQRNLEGLRINFKGTIGNHGRAKSVTFNLGSLYQSAVNRPIEYFYIKIDTKYGSIGMRLWCIFN